LEGVCRRYAQVDKELRRQNTLSANWLCEPRFLLLGRRRQELVAIGSSATFFDLFWIRSFEEGLNRSSIKPIEDLEADRKALDRFLQRLGKSQLQVRPGSRKRVAMEGNVEQKAEVHQCLEKKR
jgi:hypothetical protein